MASDAERDQFYNGTFPDGFAWSTATASYQIEGAIKEDGRGTSIWDTFSHTEGKTLDGDNGDVACDSYHKYQEDVDLMKKLGTSHYRFSIAWPRIMPDGTLASLNPAGVAYYNRLIDALLAGGIQPMVTLYHWDLPQTLQDKGGFCNPDIADRFNEYARVCYESFGDRVKYWITFNEPICTVWLGHGNGEHAPGIKDPTKSTFIAAHNLLRSHAKAYHTYKTEFKPKQNGVCGITLNADWAEPKDPSNPKDVEASEKVMQFKLGWYANPIFGGGDYHQMFKEHVGNLGKMIGSEGSPLPEFTDDEKKALNGSSDFFGLNHYTTRLVSPSNEPPSTSSEAAIIGVKEETDPAWARGQSSWLFIVPWGLRRLLGWIRKNYNNPNLYVTENGVSDGSGELNDTVRVNYYRRYINEVLKAVRLDGSDVRGYTAWSLMDNFEWAMGYSEKFGLCQVDFNDPNRPRTPKESFKFYSQVIKNNGFPKVSPSVLERDLFYNDTFPDGFVWSTATASYQIEGAVKEDGRGTSIWDTFSHTEGKTLNGDSGDVACDSYHKYQEDVELMKKLGTSHYRFSIAWPRLMPDGTLASLNPAGVAYYNRLIDALLAGGIQPMVTLYHWDLPQTLQDKGGWCNPDIADHFNDYARLCYVNFGDRVKSWITFNEPICTVWLGYGLGIHAPGIKDPSKSTFQAAHNLLRAHALAYRTYDDDFKPKQKGQCGITLVTSWFEPKDPSSADDQAASEKLLQCSFGWYANPIFGDGDYPQPLKDQAVAIGKAFGMKSTPLPEFTDEEKKSLKGSSDFFGLNHYTTRLVSLREGVSTKPMSEGSIFGVHTELDPNWTRGQSSWLYIVPWGLRKLLGWVKNTYNNPIVYVTENGISDGTGELNDPVRVDYYRRYINEVLKAVRLDGCDVRGYTAWSLMDNFEWAMGYSEKFGLCLVDFNDPNRPRTPKESFKFYSQIIRDNGFPKKLNNL